MEDYPAPLLTSNERKQLKHRTPATLKAKSKLKKPNAKTEGKGSNKAAKTALPQSTFDAVVATHPLSVDAEDELARQKFLLETDRIAEIKKRRDLSLSEDIAWMKAQTKEHTRLREHKARQRVENDDGTQGETNTARLGLPRQARHVGALDLGASILSVRRDRSASKLSDSSQMDDRDFNPLGRDKPPIMEIFSSRAATSNPIPSHQAAQVSEVDHDMANATSFPANDGAVATASSTIRPATSDSALTSRTIQAHNIDHDMMDAETSPPNDEDTTSVSLATLSTTSLEPAQSKKGISYAGENTSDIGIRLQALEDRLQAMDGHHNMALKFMAAVEEDLGDAAKGSERLQAYRDQRELQEVKKKEVTWLEEKNRLEEDLAAAKAQIEKTNDDFARLEQAQDRNIAVLEEQQGIWDEDRVRTQEELVTAKAEIQSLKRDWDASAQSSEKKIRSQLDTYRALETRLEKERGIHRAEMQIKDDMVATLKDGEGKLKGEIDEIKMSHEEQVQQLEASKDFMLKEAGKREEEGFARAKRIGDAEVKQLKEIARKNRSEWLGTNKGLESRIQELERSGTEKDDEIARLTSELRDVQQGLDTANNAVRTDGILDVDRPRKRQRLGMNDEMSDDEETKCVKCHKTAIDPWMTACRHFYCQGCLEDLQLEASTTGRESAACCSCGFMYSFSVPYAP